MFQNKETTAWISNYTPTYFVGYNYFSMTLNSRWLHSSPYTARGTIKLTTLYVLVKWGCRQNNYISRTYGYTSFCVYIKCYLHARNRPPRRIHDGTIYAISSDNIRMWYIRPRILTIYCWTLAEHIEVLSAKWQFRTNWNWPMKDEYPGIILCVRPANVRRR